MPRAYRTAALLAAAAGLAACSGGQQPAGPSWRTTFQSQADSICTSAQHQVDAARRTSHLPLYPPAFPAPAFVAYLRRTRAIGAEALAQVRALPVPADGRAERDAGLKPLESQLRLATAAADAAARPDGTAYARLAGGTVDTAPATLVPRSCLGLGLGPGRS